MYIGNQILELRKKHGMTQETLAAEMGVSVGAVSKWETGKSIPDVIMLCALADFFEVTTDELLGRASEKDFIICDDAQFIGMAVKDILAKNGYQNVRVVENGEQLYEEIKAKIPYGVFLDIHLPDIDGVDLLNDIKQQNKEIRIIMLTADSSDETKNKAVEYGADAYITKPFLPEHVEMVLKTME